jgi:hypothetical protein
MKKNLNEILALELCSNRKMSRCSGWPVLQLKAYRPYSRCTYTRGKSCIKKLPLHGRCFPPNVDVFFTMPCCDEGETASRHLVPSLVIVSLSFSTEPRPVAFDLARYMYAKKRRMQTSYCCLCISAGCVTGVPECGSTGELKIIQHTRASDGYTRSHCTRRRYTVFRGYVGASSAGWRRPVI